MIIYGHKPANIRDFATVFAQKEIPKFSEFTCLPNIGLHKLNYFFGILSAWFLVSRPDTKFSVLISMFLLKSSFFGKVLITRLWVRQTSVTILPASAGSYATWTFESKHFDKFLNVFVQQNDLQRTHSNIGTACDGFKIMSLLLLLLPLKPRLHDTTCCQTGCQTGLTTV